MKTLKIVIAAALIAASFGQANAQSNKAATAKPAAATADLKDHKCNSKCNAAAHNYVHGEKGHVCTAACKKTAPAPAGATKKA